MEESLPEPKEKKNTNKRLLFIHPGGLGDVILVLPALKELKEHLGENWKIDLLVEKRAYAGSLELFSMNQLINEVKVFDFKSKYAILHFSDLIAKVRGYNTVISSGSSPIVSILLFLSGAKQRVGFKSKLNFLLTASAKLNTNQYAAQMLWELSQALTQKSIKEKAIPQIKLPNRAIPVDGLARKRYLLLHPGVSVLSIIKRIKKTPGSLFWSDLINQLDSKLKNTDIKIVLVAGPDERETIKEILAKCKSAPRNLIDLSDRSFTIPELSQLIENSLAFVCADSAPLHLGVSVGANIVALFGPTDPNKLLPNSQDYSLQNEGRTLSVVKVKNLLCQPCLWNRRSQSCGLPICVDLQDPKDVLEALSGVLRQEIIRNVVD